MNSEIKIPRKIVFTLALGSRWISGVPPGKYIKMFREIPRDDFRCPLDDQTVVWTSEVKFVEREQRAGQITRNEQGAETSNVLRDFEILCFMGQTVYSVITASKHTGITVSHDTVGLVFYSESQSFSASFAFPCRVSLCSLGSLRCASFILRSCNLWYDTICLVSFPRKSKNTIVLYPRKGLSMRVTMTI